MTPEIIKHNVTVQGQLIADRLQAIIALNLPTWFPNNTKGYKVGELVNSLDNEIIRCNTQHFSGATFEPDNWDIVFRGVNQAYTNGERVLRQSTRTLQIPNDYAGNLATAGVDWSVKVGDTQTYPFTFPIITTGVELEAAITAGTIELVSPLADNYFIVANATQRDAFANPKEGTFLEVTDNDGNGTTALYLFRESGDLFTNVSSFNLIDFIPTVVHVADDAARLALDLTVLANGTEVLQDDTDQVYLVDGTTLYEKPSLSYVDRRDPYLQRLGWFRALGQIYFNTGTARTIYHSGLDYQRWLTSEHDVETYSATALNPIEFNLYTSTSVGSLGATTNVQLNNWDNLGTLVAYTGANASAARLYYDPINNAFAIQYGQRLYPSGARAITQYDSEVFVKNPLLVDYVLIATIITDQLSTTLSTQLANNKVEMASLWGQPKAGGSDPALPSSVTWITATLGAVLPINNFPTDGTYIVRGGNGVVGVNNAWGFPILPAGGTLRINGRLVADTTIQNDIWNQPYTIIEKVGNDYQVVGIDSEYSNTYYSTAENVVQAMTLGNLDFAQGVTNAWQIFNKKIIVEFNLTTANTTYQALLNAYNTNSGTTAVTQLSASTSAGIAMTNVATLTDVMPLGIWKIFSTPTRLFAQLTAATNQATTANNFAYFGGQQSNMTINVPSTAISFANATVMPIPTDNGAVGFTVVGNTIRCDVAGAYMINVEATVNDNGGNNTRYHYYIGRSGIEVKRNEISLGAGFAGSFNMNVSQVALAIGDILDFRVTCESGEAGQLRSIGWQIWRVDTPVLIPNTAVVSNRINATLTTGTYLGGGTVKSIYDGLSGTNLFLTVPNNQALTSITTVPANLATIQDQRTGSILLSVPTGTGNFTITPTFTAVNQRGYLHASYEETPIFINNGQAIAIDTTWSNNLITRVGNQFFIPANMTVLLEGYGKYSGAQGAGSAGFRFRNVTANVLIGSVGRGVQGAANSDVPAKAILQTGATPVTVHLESNGNGNLTWAALSYVTITEI
jgi:hypothetical protein